MKFENSNRVFILNKHGKPLMPCKPRKARLLLTSNKAKIIKQYPFTIQLLYGSTGYTQNTSLGVDTGQRHIGFAVTSQDKVLYQSEVELRQDTHKLLYKRKIYRQNRRSRKTRYRKERFLNRISKKRDKSWLPPSVSQKVTHNINWINQYLNVLPKLSLHIEIGKFDMAKMINPNISGKEYQQGPLYNWNNVKYYVLARDNYTCQLCHKKHKKLNVHHIIYRSKGGSDRPSNLITVCEDCHTIKNHRPGGILYKWYQEKKQVTKSYSGANFMNILRKRIIKAFPEAHFQYGYQTVVERKSLNLPKGHFTDAISISGLKYVKSMPNQINMIQQFRHNKRSLQEAIPRKGRKTPNRLAKRNWKNTRQSYGIYLNDYVKVANSHLKGYVNGFMSKGVYTYLKDSLGNYLTIDNKKYIKTKDLQLITHNNNWRQTSQNINKHQFK